MGHWRRRNDKSPSFMRAVLGAVLAAVTLSLAEAAAPVAKSAPVQSRTAARATVYDFLRRNRVPIRGKIQLAKVSAVIKSRYKVRSVVKIIRPNSVPSGDELKEIRKIVRNKMRKGEPIKKAPSELDLLGENILAGEVIAFHPSEKLGDLELFFSKNQSLKVQIGYDMFYIRIGDRDCTFRSQPLRKQLKNILQR